MKNRTALFVAPLALLVFLCAIVTQAQTRHHPGTRQKKAKVQQLPSLTAEQKQVVADLIDRAKSIELTYQTDPSQFATSTDSLRYFLNTDKILQFPAGPIKTYMIGMIYGYGDAGILWGMFTHTGFSDAFYGAQATVNGRDSRPEVIEGISARWHIDVMQMGLNEAQRKIFNNASKLKNELISLLARTPTADVAPTSERGEWTFPRPGMKGMYSEVSKTLMYDLGDGILAGHIELLLGQPAVTIFFLPNVPKEEVSDADLALAFASKVVKLPDQLSDTILNQEKDSEYRFRTASGKVLIVALKERKVAILRFE